MDDAFKALADPTRRQILQLLRQHGELTAGELAERIDRDITWPTVSHHFDVLKRANLIASRRQGQQNLYSLNTTVVEDLLSIIWDLLTSHTRKGKEAGS
jgi:DNA-binding transcriptional ArsR family regulator